MQRLPVLTAVITAIAVPIAAQAASTSATGARTRTVTVQEDLRHATTFAFIDPSGRSKDPSHSYPGDYVVEKAPLLGKGGKRVGTVEGVLTFITGSKNFHSDLMNRRVWILHRGSLFLEGLDSPKIGDHNIVTGGTGAYAGARGVVTSSGKFDIAHLLP